MSLISLENVSKIYHVDDVKFSALENVSLTVEKGEFLSIAGPSGSGKTTLLNLIGCLDRSSQGRVLLENMDVGSQKSNELAEIRRNMIGFIFQTFNLVPVLTAFENVELSLLLKQKIKPADRKVLVEEMLVEVGLKEFRHRKPNEMSGGQQQRVAIARALVKKPRLVLADEPTANLDSKTGSDILELMAEMNRKTDTTFLFSTHDKMVMNFGHRLVRIKDGKIESDEKNDRGR